MSDIDPLSGLSKSIRLTAEESLGVKNAIETFMIKNPVRVKAGVCQTGRMDKIPSVRRAKNVRLTAQESRDIHQNLLRYMRMHPVHIGSAADSSVEFPFALEDSDFVDKIRSFFFPLRFGSAFTVALAMVIALSSSLSVAAQSALPGDYLYRIKVDLNEKIAAALHVSADSRVRYEAVRLETRLAEAAKLAEANRLNDGIKMNISSAINAQISRIQTAAKDLADSGDNAGALSVHSQVENDLIANAGVLANLVENDLTSKDAADSNSSNAAMPPEPAAAPTVTNRNAVAHTSVAKGSVRSHAVSSSSAAQGDMQTSAQAGVTSATRRIEEVRNFIQLSGHSVDLQVLAQANARFALSKKILMTARLKLDAHQYPEAFHSARDAERTVQEAKTLVRSSMDISR